MRNEIKKRLFIINFQQTQHNTLVFLMMISRMFYPAQKQTSQEIVVTQMSKQFLLLI